MARRSAPVDRNSPAFKTASSVMGEGKRTPQPPQISPTPDGVPTSPTFGGNVKHISIEPANGGTGATVTHRIARNPKAKNDGSMDDYDSHSQTNVFESLPAAHAHVGKLMGHSGGGLN